MPLQKKVTKPQAKKFGTEPSNPCKRMPYTPTFLRFGGLFWYLWLGLVALLVLWVCTLSGNAVIDKNSTALFIELKGLNDIIKCHVAR